MSACSTERQQPARSPAHLAALVASVVVAACSPARSGNGGADGGGSPGDAGSSHADCSAAPDCAACTAIPGCGYCAAATACLPGSASGPHSGTCPVDAGAWAYYGRECPPAPDPCSSETSCASCVDRQCIYCLDDHACHASATACAPSLAIGALPGCPGQDAGPDPCLAHASCSECLASQCVQCTADGACRRSAAECPSGSAITLGRVCPGVDAGPDPCPGLADCVACANEEGCGFCSDAMSCHRGTARGPDDSTCAPSAWRWLATECLP